MSTGILLAAGEGRRFGGPKQLARVDGRPLIEHALEALHDLDRRIVVLGARADEVRAGADLRGSEIVVCDDWAEGMGASLRRGLAAAGDTDEVVIMLADQPFLTAAVVARVRAAPGDSARAVFAGAPGHPAYCASCHGTPLARDGAYHQGTVWGWLLGPFALAHARVYGDRAAALALLEPMRYHLDDYGVGSIAEIFDGATQFLPRGCPAQAWSVAETLRAWQALAGGTPPRGARRRMSRRS